ncbi:MAG: helix-turn-helix transcriptional regulator, partial [Thermomicrobiales bacterium]
MEPTRSFADRLRRFRNLSSLSQRELAERAGLSERAVSDLERGVKQRP